ncbi:MAG TPA: PilZ domain-containing protein [Thermoanaerobaculia bacterium]|nr:PilZ domain-containing protein [Thermoanaerobaculia bacterium]
MSPERRGAVRHSRRLDVRFWRRGRSQPVSGFTTNVSLSGIFLGTTQQLEPGERIRLELVDKEGGFVVEGQVARVHRVAIALRHVDQPGAGVRFLPPEELLAALVPVLRGRGGIQRRAAEAPPAAAPARPPGGPEAVSRQEADPPEPEKSSPPPSDLPVVSVDFPDRSSFLSVYHRDLSGGSLFVSTDVPARIEDRVLVEIHPPGDDSAPIRFEAKVVHRFEPEAAVGDGRNVLSGMGVRFEDREALLAALAPVLERLRR